MTTLRYRIRRTRALRILLAALGLALFSLLIISPARGTIVVQQPPTPLGSTMPVSILPALKALDGVVADLGSGVNRIFYSDAQGAFVVYLLDTADTPALEQKLVAAVGGVAPIAFIQVRHSLQESRVLQDAIWNVRDSVLPTSVGKVVRLA